MQAVANQIAERISSISVSSTMKVAAEAERLRSEGVDVVDFGAGEPDFPTPDNIKQAAIRALDQNFTKYTAAGGTAELKKAVCERHAPDFGTDYKPTECLITVGGKHVIFNLMQALINPGDEVVIPVPYWVTYKDVVNYAGGKCVFVDTDEAQGFTLTAAMLEPHLTARTKLVIINSPSQPERRGDGSRGVREDLPAHLGARHLPDDRRVLLPVPVRQRAVLDRIAARREGDRAGGRLAFEDLRHDRLAHRLRPGARGHRRRHDQAAEPLHLEPDLDLRRRRRWKRCAARRNRSGIMLAEYRKRRDFVVAAPARDSRRDSAPSRSGAFYAYPNIGVAIGKNGIENTLQFCRAAAGGSARGGGAGRSVRHRPARPHLLRHVDDGAGARARPHPPVHRQELVAMTKPVRLTPSLREKVWGKTRLAPWFPDSEKPDRRSLVSGRPRTAAAGQADLHLGAALRAGPSG